MNFWLKFLPKHKLINDILDIIYPKSCMGCNTPIKYYSSVELCEACAKEFEPYTGNRCVTCDRPMLEKGECHSCKDLKLYFDKGYCVYPYEKAVRKTIHNYKFNNMALLYVYLGQKMVDYFNEYIMNDYDFITCVPIHKNKLVTRGYNQAELLAEYISEQIGIPYIPVINRVVETKPQNQLDKNERAVNVKNAFALKPNISIENTSILIIDDIFTTGVTINECAKLLKANKAFSVDFLTLSATKQK